MFIVIGHLSFVIGHFSFLLLHTLKDANAYQKSQLVVHKNAFFQLAFWYKCFLVLAI
jgi:hypothetical protein